jgi:very-short-patch-repair endonuclease
MITYNNHPFLKNLRKDLRNHSTSAEATLWKKLQSGSKRQEPG